ncbi:MAG: class I SAM-dependent methyltransferase [Rhodobacteraceae bacterium]|nr:class I SAM-dependent methyltransferase [Paracoccaceae bacterium]
MNEPLEDLARFAFENAPNLCDPAHGCAPYHRMFSLVRLLKLDGALPDGEAFFNDQLAKVAQTTKTPRILSTGAADTGVIAMTRAAAAPHGIEPSFVLTDRCATTLRQNEIFARRAGFELECHQGDIGALDCAPVDVAVSHNFLRFLPVPTQKVCMDVVAKTLKPGGVWLGVQVFGTNTFHRSPSGVEHTADVLAETSKRYQGFDAEEVRQATLAYWRDEVVRFPLTEETFREEVAKAGFEVLDINNDLDGITKSPRRELGAQPRKRAQFALRRL